MNHDFVLIEKFKISTKNKFDKVMSNYFNDNKDKIPYVKVEDDFILYIFDTLKWLESDFHEVGIKRGIAYHGITIIKDENAEKAKKIIEAWKTLFSLGDEVIELTGEYTFENKLEYDEMSKQYYQSGQYDKVIIKREEVLETLEKLESFFKIAAKDRNYCVVHFGI